MRYTRGKLAGVLIMTAGALVALPPPASAADPCADPTIVGTDGNDHLVGTNRPDVIDGGAGNDTLTGGAGDDVLCGGPGEDKLRGKDGDDQLYGGRDRRYSRFDTEIFYGDFLAGGAGDDTLDPGLDPRSELPNDLLSFESSDAGVVVDVNAGTATGEGSDTITDPVFYVIGSRHDDDIAGGDAREILIGSGGADTIDGGAGDDEVYAGPQGYGTNDDLRNVLLGGDGDDFVVGGHGHDLLYGGPDDDWLTDSAGRDRLYGEAGDDHVSDTVFKGKGQVLDGGEGRDELGGPYPYQGSLPLWDSRTRVDLAAERSVSHFENLEIMVPILGFEDVEAPWGGRVTILGTDGPNEINAGENGPIRVRARGGDDLLIGSFKKDLLDGGAGDDSADRSGGGDRLISIEHRVQWP